MIHRGCAREGGYSLKAREDVDHPNSPIADCIRSRAKTDDNVIRPAFISQRSGWKGLSAPAIKGKVGLRLSITGQIVMEDVFVPEENIAARCNRF